MLAAAPIGENALFAFPVLSAIFRHSCGILARSVAFDRRKDAIL